MIDQRQAYKDTIKFEVDKAYKRGYQKGYRAGKLANVRAMKRAMTISEPKRK